MSIRCIQMQWGFLKYFFWFRGLLFDLINSSFLLTFFSFVFLIFQNSKSSNLFQSTFKKLKQ